MSQEAKSVRPQTVKESWPISAFPLWRGLDDLFRDGWGRRMVAVEEYSEDGTLVVRAEVPGIDPDKDVQITVTDGVLKVSAERTEEEEKEGRHFHRREFRYGSFARSIPLPEGIDEDKVVASYKDGILEVRVPLPTSTPTESAHRVLVSHA